MLFVGNRVYWVVVELPSPRAVHIIIDSNKGIILSMILTCTCHVIICKTACQLFHLTFPPLGIQYTSCSAVAGRLWLSSSPSPFWHCFSSSFYIHSLLLLKEGVHNMSPDLSLVLCIFTNSVDPGLSLACAY